MAEDPSRKLIFEYIFQHSPVSAREISSHLGISTAAVRFHLRALIQQGQVETVDPKVSRRPAPGRPGRMFRLSIQSRPDNLDILAKILLSTGLQGLTESQEHRFFQELAVRLSLAASYDYTQNITYLERRQPLEKPALSPSAHHGLPSRLAAAMDFLNRMNYSASWEARRQGPQIIFHNCPYADVRRAFPALCDMDTCLIEHLMSEPVTRMRTIDPDKPEAKTCLFQVNQVT